MKGWRLTQVGMLTEQHQLTHLASHWEMLLGDVIPSMGLYLGNLGGYNLEFIDIKEIQITSSAVTKEFILFIYKLPEVAKSYQTR